MIISASRRTEIPALFSDWFFERLAAGTVEVTNPFNPKQIRMVSLKPADVDGFVFWSKNPAPMLSRLSELQDFVCYFQFTLNGYGREVELAVPAKGVLIETFQQLSARVGAGRVIWRYDPIFLANDFPVDWHLENFAGLAAELSGATDTCIISFGDVYRKNAKRISELNFRTPDEADIRKMAEGMSVIGRNHGLRLQTCAEKIDLSVYGVTHACCIDVERLSRLSGRSIAYVKDKNQRPECGCAQSIDIGRYNTCRLGCLYCYASNCPANSKG